MDNIGSMGLEDHLAMMNTSAMLPEDSSLVETTNLIDLEPFPSPVPSFANSCPIPSSSVPLFANICPIPSSPVPSFANNCPIPSSFVPLFANSCPIPSSPVPSIANFCHIPSSPVPSFVNSCTVSLFPISSVADTCFVPSFILPYDTGSNLSLTTTTAPTTTISGSIPTYSIYPNLYNINSNSPYPHSLDDTPYPHIGTQSNCINNLSDPLSNINELAIDSEVERKNGEREKFNRFVQKIDQICREKERENERNGNYGRYNSFRKTGKPHCTNCNRSGHTANKCWRIRKCFYCGKIGHTQRHCYYYTQQWPKHSNKNPTNSQSQIRSHSQKQNYPPTRNYNPLFCSFCYQKGHIDKVCCWRNRTCLYCKESGHQIKHCGKKKNRSVAPKEKEKLEKELKLCKYCGDDNHNMFECTMFLESRNNKEKLGEENNSNTNSPIVPPNVIEVEEEKDSLHPGNIVRLHSIVPFIEKKDKLKIRPLPVDFSYPLESLVEMEPLSESNLRPQQIIKKSKGIEDLVETPIPMNLFVEEFNRGKEENSEEKFKRLIKIQEEIGKNIPVVDQNGVIKINRSPKLMNNRICVEKEKFIEDRVEIIGSRNAVDTIDLGIDSNSIEVVDEDKIVKDFMRRPDDEEADDWYERYGWFGDGEWSHLREKVSTRKYYYL